SKGIATAPGTYHWLVAGCWFGLAAGIAGAVGGVFARMRRASHTFTTLVISGCVGIALLAVWIQVTALPHYVKDREPMRPNRGAKLDGESPVVIAFVARRLAASEPGCSAGTQAYASSRLF